MADNQSISTTTPGMQAAGRMFGDLASTFNGYLANVNGDMASLQASWQGKASADFNNAMDAWESAFQSVINDLLHMAEVMGVNTTIYHQQEDDAAGIAQSFMTALPNV